MPDSSVQCVVTSPPYLGLRDYGVAGQIGLEPTVEEYVAVMVEVFREVRRVLRKDGTLWLNIGDSYTSGDRTWRAPDKKNQARAMSIRPDTPEGLKPKDLIGVPWRLAFALQQDGWYLRSDIIWHKPNAMPESVKDRPTRSHEYIFLLSKSASYYYDADAIREPSAWDPSKTKFPDGWDTGPGGHGSFHRAGREKGRKNDASGSTAAYGRNKRSVWTIPTQPFPEAHFATFPEELPRLCILAGTSPYACPHCGAPWRRVLQKVAVDNPASYKGSSFTKGKTAEPKSNVGQGPRYERGGTVGWEPTCSCEANDGSGRCIVLDPFWGSGTTGQVALQYGRIAWGVELNPEYIEISKRRLCRTQTTLIGRL